MVVAAGVVHPHAFAQSPTNHHHTPLLFTLSHISRDIISFTDGITPTRVNHNKCFIKKCILMFRAMHGHLASTPTED